jgi:predicted CoA-binding protein
MVNKPTLVIGASPNPDRYSYKAIEMLRSKGHTVIAFGQRKGIVAGITIDQEWNPSWKVDTITLYLNPTLQTNFYNAILDLHPTRVIFNPGTENDEFANLLEENEIEAVSACTLVMLSIGNY